MRSPWADAPGAGACRHYGIFLGSCALHFPYTYDSKLRTGGRGIALAATRYQHSVLDDPAIPSAIIDIFQTCDELDALQQLAPEEYSAVIDTLISRLEGVLAESKDNAWDVHWIEQE